MTNPDEGGNRSRSADRVRAEVSGVPPGKWERRLFMVLQAAIDDSGNEPNQQLYVLAGYLSSAEKWIDFAREWDATLNEEPRLDYFKLADAVALKGQFDVSHGWDEAKRDERLTKLIGVISSHTMARFHVSMRHEDFQAYVRSVPVAYRSLVSDHPYVFLAGRIVVAVSGLMASIGLTDTCDFFFDQQDGPDAVLTGMWPSFTRAIASTPEHLLDGAPVPKLGSPTFREEQSFVPIQAADMLAGAVRRDAMGLDSPAPLGGLRASVKGLVLEMDQAAVKDLGDRLMAAMQEHQALNPNAPMFAYDPATAKRNRKRARKGLKPR